MIVNQIYRWAREQPLKTALINNGRRVDYASLARAIEATRVFLAGAALPASTVAVFVSPNIFDAWMFIMAARSLGLTTIVVETPDRAERLQLRNASCLVAPQRQQGNLQTDDLAGVRRLVIPEDIYAGVNAGDPPRPLPEGPFGGHILYTSGTTGAYKKVLVDGATEDDAHAARARVSGITGDTVFHAQFFGLWTAVGFKYPPVVWRAGGGVVIDQTAERAANFLAHPITLAQTTPGALQEVLDARDPAAGRVEGLRLCSAGGFTSERLARRAVAQLTSDFAVMFACTEVPTPLMESTFETTDDLVWLRPIGEDRVQVVDEEGVECPVGVEGLLRARVSGGAGYLDDAAASAQFFRDGFFYPGDLAVRRADGRIRVLGRSADVINVKGDKHAVGPIEERLQRSLGVEEVCLFSGLSESGVEELVVAILSERDHDEADVMRALGASHLFEHIRVETFREFPRTTAGLAKTLRSELRRRLFDRPVGGA